MMFTKQLIVRNLLLGAAVVSLVASSPLSAAANSGSGAAIPLNSGQETPKSRSGASGSFEYTIQGGDFCYTLSVRNLSAPAVAAHVHFAPRHTAGSVVIPLSVGTGTSWTMSACVAPAVGVVEGISADAGRYYVNVHTPTFLSGEIRGQLK